MKILSLQELSPADVDILKNAGPEVDYQYIPAAQLNHGSLTDVDVILGYADKLTDLLEKNDSVKWIQAWSAGVDSLPQELLAKKKISLTNASGAMVPGLAEQIIGQMIAWYRQLPHSYAAQKNKQWDELTTTSYQELADKNLLLLGVGHIGQQVAKLAAAFGMHVSGVRHSSKSASNVEKIYPSNEMLAAAAEADFVLNTLPVTAKTTDSIGQEFFSQMKKTAVYINYGRGKTNDEEALLQALKTGEIGGAIMDVFKNEPLSQDSPFWQLNNILITPHTGGDTARYNQRIVALVADNLKQMTSGQIVPRKNMVDLGRGY